MYQFSSKDETHAVNFLTPTKCFAHETLITQRIGECKSKDAPSEHHQR